MNKGFVTSNGGRGRIANANGNAYINGTAYVSGSYSGGGRFWGGASKYNGYASATPTINYTPKQKAATEAAKKDFRETVDYIEILIDRIERKIDELDTIASSAYRSFDDRNKALTDQFAQVTEEITIQQKAYEAYVNRANQVNLSQDYKNRLMTGELKIEDITDSDLKDQIDEFITWYEKGLDAKYAIEELKEALSEIAETNFENVSTMFDALVDEIEHGINMLEGQIDLIENRGQFAGKAYYQELMKEAQSQMDELEEQKIALQDARNEAIWGGTIKEGSESDKEMLAEINDIEEAWQDAANSLVEYKNEMWQVDWDIFDRGIETIDNLITESEFLRDILAVNENDLFNKDTGRFTDAGWTSGALMAQDYNAYMAEADAYAQKILEINDLLANDPNNTILLDQKNEYIQAQQEAINAANEEKQAIQDLYEEQYSRMLDILDELIQKREDELEAAKDLYDYQRDIEKQTENIASLRKQMIALEGDDSESAKSQKQQLKDKLVDAEKDLEATEYDKWVDDQRQLMEGMYSEAEEFFNQRLDNIDGLLNSMINYANTNSETVNATITEATDKVGYTLTDGMQSIWNSTDSGIGLILTNYSSNFNSALTTTNNYIKGIFQVLKESTNSKVEVEKPKNTDKTEPPKPEPAPTPAPTPAPPAKKTPQVGGQINAGGAPIYSYAGDTNGLHQYFANDPIYTVLAKQNGYLLVRWHGRSDGYTGWFKESDVTALKTGGYTGNNEGMAMLHKKERVLSAPQTKAFEQLVYDILPTLVGQFDNVPKGTVRSGNVNTTMNVTFDLPNVTNAESFMKELRGNKKFERLVQSMTIDQIAGKGQLSKNRIKM